MYHQIKADNYEIVTMDSCLPLLQKADILLSDTSSMVGEFLLLNKPVVTFKNIDPVNTLLILTLLKTRRFNSNRLAKPVNSCNK